MANALPAHYMTFREFVADSDAHNKERLLELIDRNTAWIEEDEAARCMALFEELPSPDIVEVPEDVPLHRTCRVVWRAKLRELVYDAARNIKYYIIGIFILATLTVQLFIILGC
ncbi:hypothetical protein K449DRAFT_16656 [Hypoxylon sp. EC38]|nr:hypothetical protein K449DRAFT_16656 [Hypoxylon sp. EC38]